VDQRLIVCNLHQGALPQSEKLGIVKSETLFINRVKIHIYAEKNLATEKEKKGETPRISKKDEQHFREKCFGSPARKKP